MVEPVRNCDRDTFTQVIYGDGGTRSSTSTHAELDGQRVHERLRRRELRERRPGEVGHHHRRPSWPSGEAASLLLAADRRSEPAGRHAPDLPGLRSTSGAPGRSGPDTSRPRRQTTPDIAGYEANCPEFVTSGASPACGDYRPLGGPPARCATTRRRRPHRHRPTAPTAPAAPISWLARDGADHGTLWAATSAGRVFVTHNADAADPATVTLAPDRQLDLGRLADAVPERDLRRPGRPGPRVDLVLGLQRGDARRRRGTSSTSPRTERRRAPARSRTSTSRAARRPSRRPPRHGDLPVADVVRDDATQTLYVATDFGVLAGDRTTVRAGTSRTGMPRYEVMHLELQPSNRVADVRRAEALPARALRGDALAGHLEDEPGPLGPLHPEKTRAAFGRPSVFQ